MQPPRELKYITPSGKVIPVTIADSFKSRFLGLMGRKEGDYGLLLVPCNSIHTFFMRYTLDAIYLDRNHMIVGIKRFIKPYRVTMPVKGAVMVLEFPSCLNSSAFLTVGSELHFQQNSEDTPESQSI